MSIARGDSGNEIDADVFCARNPINLSPNFHLTPPSCLCIRTSQLEATEACLVHYSSCPLFLQIVVNEKTKRNELFLLICFPFRAIHLNVI
uniref:Uncharacterized protein n=1 Tax=Wuchereria bancrofti TaxID=6293 RepID=A0A1I8E9C5_WUCBA